MSIKPIITVLAVIGLSACSTAGYKCPLSESGASCASMDDAYKAAQKAPANYSGDTLIRKAPEKQEDNKYASGSSANSSEPVSEMAPPQGFPESGTRGMPVWSPAKVHRAWVAPWTDSDGVLHSGGYAYFTTPGKWNYGTLKATGEAAGVLEPIRPAKAGASKSAPKQSQVIAPAQKTQEASANQKQEMLKPIAPPKQLGTITQPYERLE